MTALRERFTDDEWALYRSGRCCWVVDFGTWNGIKHCGATTLVGAPFGYCPSHEAMRLECS